MSEYDDLLPDELTEGDENAAGMTTSQPEGVGRISQDAEGPKAQPPVPPSVSIIKMPEDVPEALDRLKIDREWLLRRAGKKK